MVDNHHIQIFRIQSFALVDLIWFVGLWERRYGLDARCLSNSIETATAGNKSRCGGRRSYNVCDACNYVPVREQHPIILPSTADTAFVTSQLKLQYISNLQILFHKYNVSVRTIILSCSVIEPICALQWRALKCTNCSHDLETMKHFTCRVWPITRLKLVVVRPSKLYINDYRNAKPHVQ